jgi:hypothetical protein
MVTPDVAVGGRPADRRGKRRTMRAKGFVDHTPYDTTSILRFTR